MNARSPQGAGKGQLSTSFAPSASVGGAAPAKRPAGAKTPIKQAANICLQPQDSFFQELDSLLSESESGKHREFGSNLALDAEKALKKSVQRGQQVGLMAACDDLAVDDWEEVDGKKAPQLFAELDGFMQDRISGDASVGSRCKNFENDVQALLRKVANDSESLSNKFTIERQKQEQPESRDLTSSLSRGLETESAARPKSRGLDIEPRATSKAELLEQLGVMLNDEENLKDHHRAKASALTAKMNSVIGGTQRSHGETIEYVDRLLRGEDGDDAHPVDLEHAAWRKSTLQTLHRGPAPPAKRGTQKGRRTLMASKSGSSSTGMLPAARTQPRSSITSRSVAATFGPSDTRTGLRSSATSSTLGHVAQRAGVAA